MAVENKTSANNRALAIAGYLHLQVRSLPDKEAILLNPIQMAVLDMHVATSSVPRGSNNTADAQAHVVACSSVVAAAQVAQQRCVRRFLYDPRPATRESER